MVTSLASGKLTPRRKTWRAISCAVLYDFLGVEEVEGGTGVVRLRGSAYSGAYHCKRCRGVSARLRVRGIGMGDNLRSFLLHCRSKYVELRETFRLPRFCRTGHSRTAPRITCTPFIPLSSCQSNTYVKPGRPIRSELKGVFGVVSPASSIPNQQPNNSLFTI